MARPLRIEYEGAVYHITSRGNDRRPIFFDDTHRERFLSYLAEGMEQFDVELYVYVLMTNHYHLVLRTRRANLSKFMHFLNSSYTGWANGRKRKKRTGHLFEGRYKAILIQEDAYLLAASTYAHLNPVRVTEWKDRPLEERKRRLVEYGWSSYGQYAVPCDLRRTVPVSCDTIWLMLGARTEIEGRKVYERYVDDWMKEDRKSPFEDVKRQSYLGTEAFGEWVESKLNADRQLSAEVVAHSEWMNAPDLLEVLRTAAEIMGAEFSGTGVRAKGKAERNMLMYLCKEESDANLSEIGGLFGISYAAVSIALKKLKERLDKDDALARKVDDVRQELVRRLGDISGRDRGVA
jgi:putative transposase